MSVKDFSYGLFLEMNRQGQYLLILDGFDEMRHAMDLDDFIYTFEQMKPLFAGEAKVVILGRPDSFLSTQEEISVLSALFDEANENVRKLQTVEVAFFSKAEVLGYLDNYLNRRTQPLTEVQNRNYLALLDKLPDAEDSLLSRPVQLKMFTKIFEECLSTDKLLNRYELFRNFIYSFIARESRKPARQPVEGDQEKRALKDDRARFMQAVAWWLLNTKKENRFVAEDIPIEIVPPALRIRGNTGHSNSRGDRRLCYRTDKQQWRPRKQSQTILLFSHKSYLEFLVANYFEDTGFSTDVYREFMANVNSEILSFLEEGPAGGLSHLRQGLLHNLGSVDARVIESCAKEKNVPREIASRSKSNLHPSTIYTHYFYVRKIGNLQSSTF